jgi:CRP-like cAMP-binding protein
LNYRTIVNPHRSRGPLTQDDIASLAGTSRPKANRVLKAAEDDGILSVRRSRIEVLDAEALERRAR